MPTLPVVHFFPYDPRLMRWTFFSAAALCAVLAAWAFSSATTGGTPDMTAWARLGVAAGLGLAFAVMLLKLRPREGWGVAVSPDGITVSRPLSRAAPMEIPWDNVSEIRRQGRKREKLLVLLQPQGRVLLGRHLFASKAGYESLAEALEKRAPQKRYDA